MHSHSNNSIGWRGWENAVTHVPGACTSVSEAEGCRLWAVGRTLSLFSVCVVEGRGVTWEDQETGRVHTGALELEGYKVSCTDSPRKVRGQ